MLTPGLGKRSLVVLVAALSVLSTACSGASSSSSSTSSELGRAVSIGRMAWGLRDRLGFRCGPGADMAALSAECDVERSFGLAGASYYERDHEVAFRYTGEGDDLRFTSMRMRNHRKVSIRGLLAVDGGAVRVALEELTVSHADGVEQEAERVMRAQIEGDDLSLDLEEVHYQRRDLESESFYVTWANTYDAPNAIYALEAQFEGDSGATRWVYQAEGTLERDAIPFGLVELEGPLDAPRPTLVTDEGESLELL